MGIIARGAHKTRIAFGVCVWLVLFLFALYSSVHTDHIYQIPNPLRPIASVAAGRFCASKFYDMTENQVPRAIWRPHTARLHKRIRIFTSKEIRKCTRKHNLFIPNVFRDLVCLYAVCDMWFTYGYTHCGDATRKPKTIIAKSLRGFDDKNVQTFWFYSVSVIQ